MASERTWPDRPARSVTDLKGSSRRLDACMRACEPVSFSARSSGCAQETRALPQLLCRERWHWTRSRQEASGLFGRDPVNCPALILACERKPHVAVFRNLGALPAISADAFRAEVRQEAA